ncbi:MAG: DUF262 domain-containing protein [Pyrobaculum sp.]
MAYAPLMTVETYLRMVLSGEIEMPAFQRPVVWPEEKMASYIDSLIRGYGVLSTIVIAVLPSGRKVLVDGNNRTAAMLRFHKGQLAVSRGGRPAKFSDLSPEERAAFIKAQLLVVFVPVQDIAEALKVFILVNSQTRVKVADLVAGFRVVDERIAEVYKLAEALKPKLCREEGGRLACRRHPFSAAAALVYWIVTRKPVSSRYTLYKFAKEVGKWPAEEVRRAVQEALKYADKVGPDLDGLAKEIIGTAARHRQAWKSYIDDHLGDADPVELAIRAALLGCVTEKCAVTRTTLRKIVKYMKALGVDITPKRVFTRLASLCERHGSARYLCSRRVVEALTQT